MNGAAKNDRLADFISKDYLNNNNNNVNVPHFVDGAFKTPTSSDVKDGRPTTSI